MSKLLKDRLYRRYWENTHDLALRVATIKPMLTDGPIRENGITLVGPKPPLHFKHDGCSHSPDFWWLDACIVHDWEYALLRVECAKLAALSNELRYGSLGSNEYYSIAIEVERLERLIVHMRKTADRNLRENIRRCSQGALLKYYWAWFCSRWYYRAVRVFGCEAIKQHEKEK